MARKPKVHERQNSATPSEAASFVEEYDRIEQSREVKLAELDAEFKKKKRDINKAVNADQKAILEDAKKVGVKKNIIRAIAQGHKGKRLAHEAFERKVERADELLSQLEDDDRSQAVSIIDALGSDFASFGLGAAAVSRDEEEDTTSAVVNAVKGSMSQDEWDKAKPTH